MEVGIRPLPDPDISLRDASDFILNSQLGRKALMYNEFPSLPLFWRDLLSIINTLVASCHMPEFTDHGLSHLCSVIDRISRWTCPPEAGRTVCLVDNLSPSEAAILLSAALLHDIGMLSQKQADLPAGDPMAETQNSMDIATWVRRTHIPRITGLVKRLFIDSSIHNELLASDFMMTTFNVASAHGTWPWDSRFLALDEHVAGLAAIVAVSDLLDEDSHRCDTNTLLHHRHGNELNQAHWIRHTLSKNRVLVLDGVVAVQLVRPPQTNISMLPVFAALRNHYRIILTYNDALEVFSAGFLGVNCSPPQDCPMEEAPELQGWQQLPGYETQNQLRHNLLKTFFPEALLDSKKLNQNEIARIAALGCEIVDLGAFYRATGLTEPRSPLEEMVLSIEG